MWWWTLNLMLKYKIQKQIKRNLKYDMGNWYLVMG